MQGTSDEFAVAAPSDQHGEPQPASTEDLRLLSERAIADPILGAVFEAIDGYAMVLNERRQVLAANDALLELLGASIGEALQGLRPGEALDCVNWRRGHDGCGSSEQCCHCGALAATLAARVAQMPVEGQCTITRHTEVPSGRVRTSDYRIRISPLTLGSEVLYVLVMHDVTAEKWRELQERMFLHDLANMLAGLSGWSEELVALPSAEVAIEVVAMARRLNESLENHRMLSRVEAGQQTLCPVTIDFSRITNALRTWFSAHECARERAFEVFCVAESGSLETDEQLLLRVLGNLIKNAFEAISSGSAVTLRIATEANPASDVGTRTAFEVHNGGAIETSVSLRLFRGRFSTKGSDRGLGLHAVQVLGEHCLGGTVDFTSSAEFGTTFRFVLPNRLAAPDH